VKRPEKVGHRFRYLTIGNIPHLGLLLLLPIDLSMVATGFENYEDEAHQRAEESNPAQRGNACYARPSPIMGIAYDAGDGCGENHAGR
jgi:hypothetical protein